VKSVYRHALLLLCLLPLVCVPASAQDRYPSRPITVVVPFAPGGPVDSIARLLTPSLSKSLGTQVVVENVVGAAGSIGVGRVATSAPDGYTLSIGHWSTHVINGAIYPLKYDLLRDLAPVAMIASNPLLVIANKGQLPAKDLKELIQWLRDNPGKASLGTAGVGSASHMGGAYFERATQTRFAYIPYRGTAPAIQDLIAGHIQFMVDQSTNALPLVKAGKIHAFAVTAKERLSAAPEIPTVDEAGLAGLYITVWYGIWTRAGTPEPIVQKLNTALMNALADPAVRQQLEALGEDVPSHEQQSPQVLHALQVAEIDKWWPLVRAAGIKAE
jgi:tripartite-type tricarboxylate transporter receptor subunit TctC